MAKNAFRVFLSSLQSICSSIAGRRILIRPVPASSDAVGYTNSGKTIFISDHHPAFKEISPLEKAVIQKGVVAHELMHQLITDFAYEQSIAKRLESVDASVFHQITNAIEDPAIEYQAPGYFGGHLLRCLSICIAFFYKRSPEINKEAHPFSQFMTALIHYGDGGFVKGEFGSEEAKQVFYKVLPLVDEAIHEVDSKRRVDICFSVYLESKPLWKSDAEAMKALMKELEKQLRSQGKNADSECGGEPDGEAVPNESLFGSSSPKKESRRKAAIKAIPTAPEEDADGEGEAAGSDPNEDEDDEGASVPIDDSDDDSEPMPEDDSPDDDSDGSNEDPDDDDDFLPPFSLPDPDDNTDSDDDTFSEDEDGDESDDLEGNDEEEDTDGKDGETNDSSGSNTSESDESGQDDTDAPGICNPGPGNGSSLADAPDDYTPPEQDDESFFDEDDYEITDDDIEAIRQEIEKAEREAEIEESQLAKSSSERINVSLPENYQYRASSCLNILVSGNEGLISLYNSIVHENEKYISLMYDQISRVLRPQMPVKNKTNSGRLNVKTLMSSRKTTRIFARSSTPPDKKDLCVMILVDHSGSMSFGKKDVEARRSVICICEVLSRLGIPFKVIGYGADYNPNAGPEYEAVHLHYVNWDGGSLIAERSKLAAIKWHNANNFDGYTIRYGTELIRFRREKHKIMCVISDGEPACYKYEYGDIGVIDTKNAISDVRKAGIEMLGIGIGGVDTAQLFSMYGDDFVQCDNTSELLSMIAQNLVKKIKRW